MKIFMQVVLSINIALVVLIDLTGYALHVGPAGAIPASEPIVSLEYAAVALGFIATCLLVLRRFQQEPIWLLVPAFFLVPLAVVAIYELLSGTGQIPPVIIRPLLVVFYMVGYLSLRRAAAATAPNLAPAGAPSR